MKYPKNFIEEKGSTSGISSSKMRYRLLADGTIIDQDTGKVAGYITNSRDIDIVWKMKGTQKQKFIRDYILNDEKT